MAFNDAQRYNDMIDSIIGGSFYSNTGIVLPYRSGTTEMRLETDYASTEFAIYLNGVFNGSVFSDVNGNVVLKRLLPKGEVEIKLLNRSNDQYFTTYVSVRDYALWLVAYAEVLEEIDDNLQEVFNNMAIETATANGIEDKFGKAIQVFNDIGQDLESYRYSIHELRLGFRNAGSRFLGLDLGVACFTQVPPFGYSRRMWGPNWVLDQSMLINHRFLDRSHSLSTTGNITGVDLVSAEPDVPSSGAAHTLSYDATAETLTWKPNGVSGPAIPVANGELFLPGPQSTTPAHILGANGPFLIFNSGLLQNDTLYFDVDDKGSISVTLVTGLPGPTAVQIAGDINAAFIADARYGGAYAAFASMYNNKLLLQSPVAANSKIIVEHGIYSGAAEVLGVLAGNVMSAPSIADGIEYVFVTGLLSFLDTAEMEYEYDATATPPRRVRWRYTSVAVWSAWVPVPSSGNYSVGGSVVLNVYCNIDDMEVPAVSPNTYTYTFDLGYQRKVEVVKQIKGLNVICDTDSLPGANQNDTITLYDDETDGYPETPDNWRFDYAPTATSHFTPSDVITARTDPLGPSPAYAWRIIDAAATSIEVTTYPLKFPLVDETPRGSSSPQQIPGGIYDYEGFEVKVSGWVRSFNAGAITATFSFSWDGGVTWPASGAANPVIEDTGGLGYETPTYISYTTQLPSDLTYPNLSTTDGSVLVKLDIEKAAGNISVSLESFTIEVVYISSRYLANATVARSRQRQYFGELNWIWSPDELSTKEQVYLGLQHKLVDRTNPLGGVTITNVSSDTPNGEGTLTYEYNAVGSTHRLKWEPYGTSYGPGLGWVPILSDGDYTLTAPDSSYITVSINYTILPVLSGTPPAAERTRFITVSDQTTTPGVTRRIIPANASLDIFDVTEYSSGSPINLFGAITESDFTFSQVINMDIEPATPYRFSHLYPKYTRQEGESLVFSPVGPNYQAVLDYPCDQNQLTTLLYEDGYTFPNDLWSFVNETMIEISGAAYNSSAAYTIDYDLLYRLTTDVIDLGVDYGDYIWFADYFLWDRFDNVLGEYETEVPLFVNIENGRAYLTRKSTMNRATAKLMLTDANDTYEISKRYWRFLNDTTIEIDLARISAGQYYLTHDEKRVYESSRLTTVFEHKSGTTAPAAKAASWSTIQRNSNVQTIGSLRYHKLRVSISGTRSVKDFRLHGAVLKGLHMFGSDPDIPGLTNVWGT